MINPHPHLLTRRQALARILVSVAVGTLIAVILIGHGVASSNADVQTGPPGNAASQLGVLQDGTVDQNAPSAVESGLGNASADPADIHQLDGQGNGNDVDIYAAPRSNGGACNAVAGTNGTVGTTCVNNIPASGITIDASDATGWVIFGFTADDVTQVDVIVDGQALPATMLPNAYTADLGTHDLSEATSLVVHHADGSTDTVSNSLQAPPSA
jgi:hypothetical protein